MHTRQQIRNYVVSQLDSLRSLTGDNEIYKSRSHSKSSYPWISVYTGDENIQVENPGQLNSNKRYRRFQQCTVEIGVLTNTNPDDALDDFAVMVEQLMAADETMGGGVVGTDLQTTTFLMGGDIEQQFMSCRLNYIVEYRTDDDDPEQFLA